MRIVYAVAGLWLLLGTGYAAWFLLHDYEDLRAHYLGLGPLYRQAQWTTDFFTPTTKEAGNRWALLGLLTGPLAFGAVVRAWRSYRPEGRYRFPLGRADLPYVLLLTALLLGLWTLGHQALPPAYDEVFSAFHIAGAGPFVALSYYMLPNNHILFNVLNAVLFGWTGELLLTGRLVALVAYLVLGVLQYSWLRELLGQRFAAAALSVLLAVLLPVWGFATQARGYLPLLLFSWGAFVAVWYSLRQGGRGRRMETVFAVCCVLGYATVLVFLYLHVALLIWTGWTWLRRRRVVDLYFIGSQAVAGVAILLFYLPAISFSGLEAITANRYVAPAEGYSVLDYLWRILTALPDYVNYTQLDLGTVLPFFLPFLALAPLLLLWLGRRPWRDLGQYYLILMVTTGAIVIGMRAMPFHRSIILQLQWVGMMVALLPVALVEGTYAVRRGGTRGAAVGVRVVAVGWLVLAGWLIWRTPEKFSLHLYYYPIVPTYQAVEELLDVLPEGASVGGSDEAFYPLYLLGQRRGGNRDQTTEYYIKLSEEALPPGEWSLVRKGGAGLGVWRVQE